MKIRLADITIESTVDGPGVRKVLWTQGCNHGCKNCHNQHTHDVTGGKIYDLDEIHKILLNRGLTKHITISGGEPFLQAFEVDVVITLARMLGYNDIWVYSGFTYEELLSSDDICKHTLLHNIDVLVDGRFVEAEQSWNCVFRGSKNQRIIDVKNSLELGQVIELSRFYDKK